MAIMTHAKFHSNWLMLTSIFGIWAFEPPGPGERPDRVKKIESIQFQDEVHGLALCSRGISLVDAIDWKYKNIVLSRVRCLFR